MTLFLLARKNLLRHRPRTIVTMLAVALAAATLFSILSFDRGFRMAMQEELASTGVHLFVSTEGCPSVAATLLIRGGEIPRYMKMEHLAQTRRTEGVRTAGGYLIFTGIDSDDNVDLFFGISDDVRKLKPHWKLRGTWFTGPNDIILGDRVAAERSAQVGQTLQIPSVGREFRVSGILERTQGQDDNFIFLPLPTAQSIFKKEGKLTAIGVQLQDVGRLAEVKSLLETMPDAYVVPAEQMSDEIMNMVGGIKALMYSIVVITLLVSVLGLMNTILMASFERQTEFAYFRCVGAGKSDIVRLILLETSIICTLGVVVGIVVGYGLSSQLDQWMRQFLPYSPAAPMLRPGAGAYVVSIGATFAMGLLSAVYPAQRACGVSPLEAVRNA